MSLNLKKRLVNNINLKIIFKLNSFILNIEALSGLGFKVVNIEDEEKNDQDTDEGKEGFSMLKARRPITTTPLPFDIKPSKP